MPSDIGDSKSDFNSQQSSELTFDHLRLKIGSNFIQIHQFHHTHTPSGTFPDEKFLNLFSAIAKH